jgi:3-hydroxybutyryl-CoA dehydratase
MTALDDWFDTHRGKRFPGNARTVTETDVLNFAGVSGDFAPIHTDETFAAGTRYGGRIAHGLLTLSIVTTLIGTGRPFRALASYGYDGLRFVGVVKPGDTVSTEGEVVSARAKGDDHAIVTVRYEARNQSGEVVLVCDHLLLCQTETLLAGSRA